MTVHFLGICRGSTASPLLLVVEVMTRKEATVSRSDRTSMIGKLANLIPDARLHAVARELGTVVRDRKRDVPALVWSLVLGFGSGRAKTLIGLKRTYESVAEENVAWSSFYGWFTPGLVKLLKHVYAIVVTSMAGVNERLEGVFEKVPEVVATDAMVIRLNDGLKRCFPGCRTNHTKAAAKLHLVTTVVGTSKTDVKITSEKVRDVNAIEVGPWVGGRLLLFDLGYYKFQLFDRIDRNKGWFISRAKSNFNPTIVEVNRAWRGRSIPVVGEKLQDVIGQLQREVIDVMAEVSFYRRAYGGRQSRVTRTFRVVGVRDASSGEYHIYITNVPVDVLTANEVAQVYAARWSVELVFRELTAHHRVKDMPSGNKNIVLALIYGSLLSLLVSRQLTECLKARLEAEEARRLSHEQVAVVFAQYSGDILRMIVMPHYWHHYLSDELEEILRRQCMGPHRTRRNLKQRVEVGEQLEHLKSAQKAA